MGKAVRVLLVVTILLVGTMATAHISGGCQPVAPGEAPCKD